VSAKAPVFCKVRQKIIFKMAINGSTGGAISVLITHLQAVLLQLTAGKEIKIKMKRMTASAAFIEPRETVIPWGVASSIDIYDCDAETIRDADKIRRFVAELCDLIEMKKFGDTIVVHFWRR